MYYPTDAEDEPEHPKHDILDEPPDEMTPDGRPIPKGHHWDGIRIVKDYKGSKRPKGISSDFWRSIGPKDRKKLIEEEEAAQRAKSAAAAAEGKTPSKRQQRRERRQQRLEVTRSQPKVETAGEWEELPTADAHLPVVPAMPCTRPAPEQQHRGSLRSLIREKIRELEFQNALELYGAVARLVSKDEVSRTPKAQEARSG